MLRRASRVRSSSAWTDLNRPAARPEACDPAVWRSTTTTDRPASAQCRAVLRPSAPAPMTTTSASTRPLCLKPNGPGFSQTETCWLLSLVKGCRLQPFPPVAQPHPGQLRHQVELGRPHVPERHGAVLALTTGELDVVPLHGLRGRVIRVGHPAFLAHMPGQHVLPGREPAQLGNPALDDEAAAGPQMAGGVAEAGDLRVLAGQVHDRVEHQVGQREGAVHRGGGDVADGDRDSLAAGLGAQPGHHGPGQVDAVHFHAAAGQRQRDPPGPDAQLQRPPAARQLGQHPGRRLYRPRPEDPRRAVVRRGDTLTEVTVFILHCRDVTRSRRGLAAGPGAEPGRGSGAGGPRQPGVLDHLGQFRAR